MKKFFVFLAVIALVAGMSFAGQVQTFNYSATVLKYIEVGGNPSRVTIGFAATIAGNGRFILPANGGDPHTYIGSQDNVVYANCPFTITYAGNNSVPDGLPILARQEVNGVTGNGRWDRLQTQIEIWQRTNVDGNGSENYHTVFVSNPDGAATGTWTNGPVVTFNNAPHNGEVNQSWYFDVALPHKSPDFGTTGHLFGQSADAGTNYTCQIVATYAVI